MDYSSIARKHLEIMNKQFSIEETGEVPRQDQSHTKQKYFFDLTKTSNVAWEDYEKIAVTYKIPLTNSK